MSRFSAPALLIALASSAFGQEGKPIPTRPDPPYEPLKQVASLDQLIAGYRERAKAEPTNAGAHSLLAQFLIRKARETGDLACYDEAEEAARAAVRLAPKQLAPRTMLIQALSANHRFREALALAEETYRLSGEPAALLLVGDARLELGQYAEAEKAFRDLQARDKTVFLNTRFARLAELHGRTDEALALMRRAQEAEAPHAVTPGERAWYPMRLGEMAFNAGRLDEAERQYQAALKDHPRYPAALAGLGRVLAARGKLDEGIDLFRKAVAVSPEVALVVELGDLYQKAGNSFLAKLNYDRLLKLDRARPGNYRELSLFLANHDLEPAAALELAKKDLDVRRDVYAYDTLAWALHKNGRHADAAEALKESLKLGTRDAGLVYHAGMIRLALGDKEKGKELVRQALAINPHFSALQAERARQALAD
jgi:tetratricopeptide (TPR) repeat protein